MLRRLSALIMVVTLMVTLSSCHICNRVNDVIWGNHTGAPVAQTLEDNRDAADDPYIHHVRNQWQIFFRNLNEMHKFWDRHFMLYDWDDPYLN